MDAFERAQGYTDEARSHYTAGRIDEARTALERASDAIREAHATIDEAEGFGTAELEPCKPECPTGLHWHPYVSRPAGRTVSRRD